jgi:hypothetical protein
MSRNAIATALALAIGVGVLGSAFSGLHVLRVERLAYAEARRVCLLRAWDDARQRETFDLPLAAFVALAPRARSFERLAAYRYWSAALGDGRAERVQAYRVTADTFPLLGAAPLAGRALEALDCEPGAPKVAVLGHGLWLRRFAGTPDAIGRTILLDGEPHRVVGVMPASFEFPADNFKGELWTPLAVDAEGALADPRGSGSVVAIGRLRSGRSPASAEAELRAELVRRAAEDPATFRALCVRVVPLADIAAAPLRPALGALLALLREPPAA